MKEKDKEVKEETTKKKTSVKKTVKKEEPKKEVEIQEVIVEKKTGFNYAEVIVIMIITLILGGVIGSFITYLTRDKVKEEKEVCSSIPKEMNEFLDAYDKIMNDYYEKVDSKGLLEAGINGMLQYLDDDYSVYMDKDVTKEFDEQVEGKYTGIGVEIQLTDNGVVVNRVFDKSPAKEAGLKKGDIFLKVNGTDVTKETPAKISDMIKNGKSKNVEIVIKRDDEEKTFTLTLKEVDIESVETEVFEKDGKKIGYIKLSVFASNTYQQFERKLLELEGKKIDSLIIDVRDNSGGYLSSVTDIASLFLSKSKIVYQLDTKGIVEQVYATSNTKREYDIVVLANKASASASEILAGALQESYGAKVIGTNTFGKGTVQAAYKLESGATVKYTIQKWLTPKGNWINEKGITPDIEVELDEEYYKTYDKKDDNQLQKAIEELSK
ncbi:MAG: S41 family peptidase [Bacilli bacterium]|nr:S41 family peptidase [Bacilli bacterium]